MTQTLEDLISHRAHQAAQQVTAYLKEGRFMTDVVNPMLEDLSRPVTLYFWADRDGLHWSPDRPDAQTTVSKTYV